MPSFTVGASIPPDTAHAVSVSLPTWGSNVGYEEGDPAVVNSMTTGYPRFFVHRGIEALAQDIVARHGSTGQRAFLFPTHSAASRCQDFVKSLVTEDLASKTRAIDFVLDSTKHASPMLKALAPRISAVILPDAAYSAGKQYWQHTGDGVSSRQAEFCHVLFTENLLVPVSDVQQQPAELSQPRPLRGPKRYQRKDSLDGIPPPVSKPPSPPAESLLESQESSRFLEERFGRNLDLSLVEPAKSAIRRRIAGSLAHDADHDNDASSVTPTHSRGVGNLKEGDVFLFPAGMNAIYNTHRALLKAREPLKSINLGFPYVDTLKILEKFGPGCQFYGRASDEDLDDLEKRLRGGERFLALFCEFPGNPLLICPDLERIRKLADEFDFALVVDETIGTFANINVLQVADVVVSSLTKIFSGDCNVMGGGLILNPEGRYYRALQAALHEIYEDAYWPEDVVFMERNSRDFMTRMERINVNSEAICDILLETPIAKSVYYPKHNPSRCNYDKYRLPNGGYGGLVSVVFQRKEQAHAFFDALDIAKGPSLGTNFTLASPYVLLAHYQELDWAAEYGVDPDLVRISVGLEETDELRRIFEKALAAATAVSST
ncbi:pyridoxal phosphate-dependent transferase [Stachybotrys elegans]|uniref:cystathionine gamma-synthase n=1 Tax=Stachybotrys elegans TaxID=80388 RepID=A0A8K0T2Y2_9HYPO|nr:pyridoxal phosphate-dependent transferase [Stachybotrys elegans]